MLHGSVYQAHSDVRVVYIIICISQSQGLLKMQLLQRLRYILEVVRPSPQTVLGILEILIRIARHSLSSATQVDLHLQALKILNLKMLSM